MDPAYDFTHRVLGEAYVALGMYDAAIAEFRKAVQWNPQSQLARAFALSGRRGEAVKLLAEMKDRAKTSYVSPLSISEVYVALGERDSAFEWLERAYEDHSEAMPFLNVFPNGIASDRTRGS
jgi:tetratricopeptide (TPR) repeat protein